MDLGLTGKNALVTGASKGIGLAIARALAAEGAHVVAGARSASEGLADLVEAGQVSEVQVDLSTADGPEQLVAAAREHGPLHILVNNVGAVTPRLDGFLEITDDQWLASLNLTFLAAVRTTRAALPDMLAAGGGTIVNTCSVNAFLPDPGVIDYSAAKAALANFSKSLSKEVGPRGIRVNTVSPGPVSTDLWMGDKGVAATVAGAQGGDPKAVADAQAAQAPTGRFTTPEEVADLVVLLAGERAGNVTGSDFVIDGGLVQTL
jgi:NAD(P)-dependent dehydrogenase (short-subunit alcohol dehydrogenase family)